MAGYAYAQIQRPSAAKQRRCLQKSRVQDTRGFMLRYVYGVPERNLDMYPPTVYSIEHAVADYEACRRGQDMPHFRKIVRVDKVVGSKDPRVYALTQYHGFSKRDFEDGKLLKLLPYTTKDAQIDISTYQKTGRPYYVVDKWTTTVRDPKRGTVRNWRHKGFDDRFRYDVYDPKAAGQRVGTLNRAAPKHRINVSRYPKRQTAAGQWVVNVPCTVMPAMCRRGESTFTYPAGAAGAASDKAAKVLANKQAKLNRRRSQVAHSKKMEQLSRRMKDLNKESDKYKQLYRQRNNMRRAFRAAQKKK